MSHTQESLMVLDLLENGKISVADAEMLICAMQPRGRIRLMQREMLRPGVISVTVDGTQDNLDEVMQRLGRAFAPVPAGEVSE
jgi:hypothetical protein